MGWGGRRGGGEGGEGVLGWAVDEKERVECVVDVCGHVGV